MKIKTESKIFSWNNHKSLKTMVLDSAIIGAGVGIATLSNGMPTGEELWIAGKTFALFFFSQLAFEKGIKKYSEKRQMKKTAVSERKPK